MVKFLLGVQSPRLLSVVILVPFFGWGEGGLWFGFETSKERRKNVVSNSPEGLLQVSCKNQRFFFSYCSPCQALKQLSINIEIILPESPQTEICQIIESWFELIPANHLQHHQPYVTWNPHPSALQNQSEKPTHFLKNTIFLVLSFGKKPPLQEDIFLLCRSLHWQLHHTKHRLLHRYVQSLAAYPHPTEHFLCLWSHFWLAYDTSLKPLGLMSAFSFFLGCFSSSVGAY